MKVKDSNLSGQMPQLKPRRCRPLSFREAEARSSPSRSIFK